MYFTNPESAVEAVQNVDGTFWHGRRLSCALKTKVPSKSPVTRSAAPTTTLYIGNIPYETTDAELNAIFGGLENVVAVRVAVDRTTGWPRGFAHADFADVDSAVKAYNKIAGIKLGERQIYVDYSAATRRPQRAPRSGDGSGVEPDPSSF